MEQGDIAMEITSFVLRGSNCDWTSVLIVQELVGELMEGKYGWRLR